MKRRLRTAAVLLAAGLAGALGLAVPASAHVVVNPNSATQGGYARIDFQMPTESDTLTTTKLDVQLDPAHPVASVSTMQVPGWTARVVTGKLATPLKDDDGNSIDQAVTEIVWTADSAASAIKPGQFLEFPFSLGPLPTDTDKLVFKAVQTYSDGSTVNWIEMPGPDGAEPDHPAPTLTLAKATAAAGAASDNGASGALAVTLGVIGAVLGLGGLVLGGLAFVRTRRAGQPAAGTAAPTGRGA